MRFFDVFDVEVFDWFVVVLDDGLYVLMRLCDGFLFCCGYCRCFVLDCSFVYVVFMFFVVLFGLIWKEFMFWEKDMKKWIVIVLIVLVLLYGFLMSIKLGVYFIIDGIVDIGDEFYLFDVEEFGLQWVEQVVVVVELLMFQQIDQFLGFVYDLCFDCFYMIIDQVEFFILNIDFEILVKYMLSGQMFFKWQGLVEVVVLVGEDQIVVVMVGQYDLLGWVVFGDLREKISCSVVDFFWFIVELLFFGEMVGFMCLEGMGCYFVVEEDLLMVFEFDLMSGDVIVWVFELLFLQGDLFECFFFVGVVLCGFSFWIVSQLYLILFEVDEEMCEVCCIVELLECGEYFDFVWVGDELLLMFDYNFFDEWLLIFWVCVEEVFCFEVDVLNGWVVG